MDVGKPALATVWLVNPEGTESSSDGFLAIDTAKEQRLED
jgi:hypothetical protein